MSAATPRASRTVTASSRETSSVTPRLLAWYDANTALVADSPSPTTSGGSRLMGSPPGGSTLITSAPRSAKSFVQ